MDDSIQKSLSVSTSELEIKWLAYLKRKHTWFSYLSYNIYTILFSLAAVITVYGFIRLLKKKRAYVDDDEEKDRGGGSSS
jgi:cellulose synthase/poly-beta-1,6-N-acetylglucosamine synthase-like glycosyltransferase